MPARTIAICLSVVLTASAALPLCAMGSARAAGAGGASLWSLAVEKTGRTCNLKLRFDSAGAAGEVAMPAGCRRAVPAIRQALAWSINDAGQISFNTEAGQSLLTFARQADGSWRATAADGSVLALTPTGQVEPAGSVDGNAVALAQPEPTPADGSIVQLAASTGTAKSMLSSVSAQALAGRYAVMRGDRDTGCMVTLDTERGRDGPRARLAPACRDQGIIVFDPVNWHTKGAQIVLTARKGHSILLDKDENGVWVKMPKDAKALGLKPL